MQVDLVQVTTRDGVRLDGMFQLATAASAASLDAVCMVHGTGGNFYGSTLFDEMANRLIKVGCSVLRINTRGHDGISTAATAQGGRRLGAAYELVDDCRHDLAAWVHWLVQRVGPRVGLIGHSLGAVKCLYAVAHDPTLAVQRLIAISPPRLSYSWFCTTPEGSRFLESYSHAEQRVDSGEPNALIEVKLPLPIAIAAAGYVEKYGPDERYNFLNFAASVQCPTLFTFGGIEVANNMAFRDLPEATRGISRNSQITVETITGADHFYSGVRGELLACVDAWLTT